PLQREAAVAKEHRCGAPTHITENEGSFEAFELLTEDGQCLEECLVVGRVERNEFSTRRPGSIFCAQSFDESPRTQKLKCCFCVKTKIGDNFQDLFSILRSGRDMDFPPLVGKG